MKATTIAITLCNNIITNNINKFGFVVEELITFPRRGDMGLLNFKKEPLENINNTNFLEQIQSYEYLIVARKVGSPEKINKEKIGNIFSLNSKTSKNIAKIAGYDSVEEYFNLKTINKNVK